MTSDVRVGVLRGVDEAQRGRLGVFGHVVRECILDVPLGLLVRDDQLCVLAVASAVLLTGSSTPSKWVSVNGAAGAGDAPPRSKLRSWSRS